MKPPKELQGLNDEQLTERIETLRAELQRFTSENRWVREDAVEAGEAWLERARAIVSLKPEEAWPSGSKSLREESILEVCAAFVLTSGEFRRWLKERLGSVSGGAPGVSTLSRVERDKELQRLGGDLGAARAELTRRGLDRQKCELEDQLAALDAV